jgi:LacI family transcriptional regulator
MEKTMQYKPNNKGITISDVAEAAKVSKATVSRVINKKDGVSPEIESRVLEAVKELNFRPNKLAQALKRKKSNSLGLVIPSVENPVFAQVIKVVEETSQKYGFSIILCNTEGDIEKEEKYINLLVEKQVDGIIIDALGAYHDGFQCAREFDVPLVVIGHKIEGFDCANVAADNILGGYNATSYLIHSGCRKIAFLFAGYEATSAIEDRFQGYRKALIENGIVPDENIIVHSRLTFEAGSETIEKLLSTHSDIDAVFASNDFTAIGCLDKLVRMNYKIPEQISVFGYDNISFSNMTRPRLSTVNTPIHLLGNEAVKKMLRIIYTKKDNYDETMLNPQIILRETTKPIAEL